MGDTGVAPVAWLRDKDSAERSIRPRSFLRWVSGVNPLFRERDRARIYKAVMHDLSHHHLDLPTVFLEPYQRQKWAPLPLVPDRHHPPHPRVIVSLARGPLYTSPLEGGGSTCNNIVYTSRYLLYKPVIYVYKVVGARRGFRSLVLLRDLRIGIDRREKSASEGLLLGSS